MLTGSVVIRCAKVKFRAVLTKKESVMDNSFMSLPVPLEEFRPHSAHFAEAGHISTLIADESYTSVWHGLVVIESYEDHSGKMIGFELYDPKWNQLPFIPALLLKSFFYDCLFNKQHQLSKRKLLGIYWPAFWLTLSYPSTWWIK